MGCFMSKPKPRKTIAVRRGLEWVPFVHTNMKFEDDWNRSCPDYGSIMSDRECDPDTLLTRANPRRSERLAAKRKFDSLMSNKPPDSEALLTCAYPRMSKRLKAKRD
jgi:hypothetical protein